MPTLDELREAARIQAQRQFDEEQENSAKETRQLDERVKNEPIREDQPNGKDTVFNLPSITIKKFPPKDEQRRKARELMRAADDMVRTAAGPVGNALASVMPISGISDAFSNDLSKTPSLTPPSTLPEEYKLSEDARARNVDKFGKGLTTGVEIGGVVGQALALPGAAFAGPVKAAATSGTLGIADTLIDRLSTNKPLTDQEGVSQMVGSGTLGAAFGFGGYHIGNLFSKLVGKLAGEDKTIGKLAAKHIQSQRKIVNEAGQAMDNSGVVIKKGYFAHFVNTLQKDLEALPFSKDISKNGWRAFNSLRAQTGKGRLEDVGLRRFNEYRKAIRDSVRSSQTGMLKPSVSNNDLTIVNTITKRMNEFIDSLPTRAGSTVKGDASAGVSAWHKMNEYHQRVARADRLADFILNAESHALRGKKDIVVALQDEFQSLFLGDGRKILEAEFPEKAMQDVLSELAHGNFTEQVLTRMDRLMGSTLFSPVFRAIKSGHSAGFAADQMRKAALEAVDLTLELPMSRPGAGQLGAALGVGANSAIPQSTPMNAMPPYQGQLPNMPPGMPPLQSQKMLPTPSKIPPQQGAGMGTNSPNVSPDPLKAVNPPRRP